MTMDNPLRVGVIGLGASWRAHYRPALLALRKHFQVRALCDQIYQHALAQAKHLRCDATLGPVELLERDDVDAVLLLDTQWFQLWPAEQACRRRKPVFCTNQLVLAEPEVETLARQIADSQTPLVVGMETRHAPATVRLRELLATRLGTPRLLACTVTETSGTAEDTSSLLRLFGSAVLDMLDGCAGLLAGEPQTVLAAGTEERGVVNLWFEFTGGGIFQMTRLCGAHLRPSARLQVLAENGTATVHWPVRVAWTDGEGIHQHVPPVRHSPSRALLERFADVVRGRAAVEPTADEVLRSLRWLRAAARSFAEGKRMNLLAGHSGPNGM
jgi:predicted dehydrogenase